MGDDATGHRQPEGLGLVVDVPPQTTALCPHRSRQWVDPHAGHGRQVDHQAAVAHRVAGHGVTPASDRDRQLPLLSEAHGGQHVGGPRTAGDDGRLALDVPVPNLPGGLEVLVARFEHNSREFRDLHLAHPPSEVSR
jgi:hypothetical protein